MSHNLTPSRKNNVRFYESLFWRNIFSLMTVIFIAVDFYYFIHATNSFELSKYGVGEVGLGSVLIFTWKYWFPPKDGD